MTGRVSRPDRSTLSRRVRGALYLSRERGMLWRWGTRMDSCLRRNDGKGKE